MFGLYASPSSMSTSLPSSCSSLFVVSFIAIVVAFDVAVLSNALESFTRKGGGKDSFDLFICMSFSSSDTLAGNVTNSTKRTMKKVWASNNIIIFRILTTRHDAVMSCSTNDLSVNTQVLFLVLARILCDIFLPTSFW